MCNNDQTEMSIKKITDAVNHILHGDYNGVRFNHVEGGSKDLDRILLSIILSSYILSKQIKILERKITFISELRHMTYQHYSAQPKQMIEWCLFIILIKIRSS